MLPKHNSRVCLLVLALPFKHFLPQCLSLSLVAQAYGYPLSTSIIEVTLLSQGLQKIHMTFGHSLGSCVHSRVQGSVVL